jgi:hypothetical protein
MSNSKPQSLHLSLIPTATTFLCLPLSRCLIPPLALPRSAQACQPTDPTESSSMTGGSSEDESCRVVRGSMAGRSREELYGTDLHNRSGPCYCLDFHAPATTSGHTFIDLVVGSYSHRYIYLDEEHGVAQCGRACSDGACSSKIRCGRHVGSSSSLAFFYRIGVMCSCFGCSCVQISRSYPMEVEQAVLLPPPFPSATSF